MSKADIELPPAGPLLDKLFFEATSIYWDEPSGPSTNLKAGQKALARHFGTQSGREMDKLQGVAWHPGLRGAPILDDALASFECEVISTMPAGDHMLALGVLSTAESLTLMGSQ